MILDAFWHWWVLAAILVAIDALAATTLFVWMGVAAIVVGLVALVVPGLGWEAQIALFGVGSLISVGIWRYYRKTHPAKETDPDLNRRGVRHIGQTFVLREAIANREGRLEVDGVLWRITGEDAPAGTTVTVEAVDGATLRVTAELAPEQRLSEYASAQTGTCEPTPERTSS